MVYISERPDPTKHHQTPLTEFIHNMGALAPILPEPRPEPTPPKPEPYRPSDASRVALRPDAQILTAIKLYCVQQGITLTSWFEKQALETIYNHERQYGRLGAKAPQMINDSKKVDKSVSSIARIYFHWNAAFNRRVDPERIEWKPTWTSRDETQSLKVKHVRLAVQEIAIIRTVCQKELSTGRINSFRYYVPQILRDHDEAKDLSDKQVDAMLSHFRAKAEIYLNCDSPNI